MEESLRLGADAVSVHVNLGSLDERQQIADLGAVSDACDQWNVPLMAMVYPRGPRITNPRDPELVAHAATLAADLGADIVKTPFVGTAAEMRDITEACPIPMIVAGGPAKGTSEDVLSYVDDALDGGVAGVADGPQHLPGRRIPGLMAREVADLVHGIHPAAAGGTVESLPRAS